MKKRAITGLLMVLVLVPLVIFPEMIIPFQIVMIAGVVVAALEMLRMFEKEKPLKREVKIITLILTLGIYSGLAWFTKDVEVQAIATYVNTKFMIATILVILISLGLLVLIPDFTGADVGKIVTIAFYVGLGGASLVVLRIIGLRFISYLLLTTMSTDVFAYLFGIKFGKHKMAPNISPKKSWEGAIAGTIMATLIAGSFGIFYGKIFPSGIFNPAGDIQTILTNTGLAGGGIEIVLIFILTILLSVVGQVGDLVASKFKRTYDIKDFGNIFPGHGGVMDRFDSAFFAGLFLVMTLFLFAL